MKFSVLVILAATPFVLSDGTTSVSIPTKQVDLAQIYQQYKEGKTSFLGLAKAVYPDETFLLSRMGLSRAHPVRDVFAPLPSLDKLTVIPNVPVDVLMELQHAVNVARDVKNYLTQLQLQFASAAALVPEMVAILLSKELNEPIWNAAGALSTILSAFPVPIMQQVANTVKVAIRLSWLMYAYANRPPASQEKAKLTEYCILAMDIAVDLHYRSVRNAFRNASMQKVQEFGAQVEKMRAKFTIDEKKFLANFKVRMAQAILNGSTHSLYSCTSNEFSVGEDKIGQEGRRCQGGVPISSKNLDIVHYKVDLSRGAYDYLDAIPNFDWAAFYLREDGWVLPVKSFRCWWMVCTGPSWPVGSVLKPGEQEYNPKWDRPKNKPPTPTNVPGLPEKTSGKLNAASTDKLYVQYITEKQNIQWLAERALPNVPYIQNLGLARADAVKPLMDPTLNAMAKTPASQLSQDMYDHLQKVLNLADLIKRRMIQLQIHYASCVSIVKTATSILLTPEDYPRVWAAVSIATALLSMIPGYSATVFTLVSLGVDQLRRATKPTKQSPNSLEDFVTRAIDDINVLVDRQYEVIRQVVLTATPERLVELHDLFQDGAFRIDAGAFTREFEIRYARKLLQNHPTIKVSKCTKNCLEGHLVDGAYYKLNIGAKALHYLNRIPVVWREVFLNTNSWEMGRDPDYTCDDAFCPIVLARNGWCNRCNGVNWIERLHTAQVYSLNGAVPGNADLNPENYQGSLQDKRWRIIQLNRSKQNTALSSDKPSNTKGTKGHSGGEIDSNTDDTTTNTAQASTAVDGLVLPPRFNEDAKVFDEFFKGKTLKSLAEQYQIDLDYHLGLKRHLTPHPLSQKIVDELLKTNPLVLDAFRKAIYVASAFHERAQQFQIHSAAAAATIPDTVRLFMEPTDNEPIWIAVEAFVDVISFAMIQLRPLRKMAALVKTQFIDVGTEKAKAIPTDILLWNRWATVEMDRTADWMYKSYKQILAESTLQTLLPLAVAAEQGIFGFDAPEFLRDFRAGLAKQILNAHPRFKIFECHTQKTGDCLGGVTFPNSKIMYKDNLTPQVRDFLRDIIHLDWQAFYVGESEYNLARARYTCSNSVTGVEFQAVLGSNQSCSGPSAVTKSMLVNAQLGPVDAQTVKELSYRKLINVAMQMNAVEVEQAKTSTQQK